MLEKFKKVLDYMNSKGVALPTVRDPKTGLGSVSLTMLSVSFALSIIGMIGKLSKVLGDIDMSQCLWLLTISASLYFGRKMQAGPKGGVNLDESSDNKGAGDGA